MGVLDTLVENPAVSVAAHVPTTADGGESWSLDRGVCSTSPTKTQFTTIPANGGLATIAANSADGVVEVDVVNSNGSNTDLFGLVFRGVSASSYLCVLFNSGAGGSVSVHSYDGSYTELASTAYSSVGTTLTKLCVSFNGNKIRVWVNELTQIEVVSTINQTAVRVGILDRGTASLREFTNFRLGTKNENFDIFAIEGQSNAGGVAVADRSVDVFDKHVFSLDQTGAIIPAYYQLDYIDANYTRFGFCRTFFDEYVPKDLQSGRYVLLVPNTKGGSGFQGGYWNPGNSLYVKGVWLANNAVLLAGDNKIIATLWHQGEADGLTEEAADAYEVRLNAFVNTRRVDIGSVPIVAGTIPDSNLVSSTNIQVNGIIQTVFGAHPMAYVTDLSGLPTMPDNIHFIASSYRTMGTRYYTSWVNAAANQPQQASLSMRRRK